MASTAASHPITEKKHINSKTILRAAPGSECTCRDETIFHTVSKLTFSRVPKDDFFPHSTSSIVPSVKNQ